MNIGEVLDEITATQHRLAVISSLVEYIETFLPSDTEGAEVFFVEGPCLQPEVPTSIVEEILELVTKIQGEQNSHLENLRKMETKDVKPKPKRSTRSRKPRGKSNA
tara:strand:+ start:712 stop:1029 length:318 start_codon:yes stop_codon:yes gene_type:complete